ncbi:hypothetical protein ACTG9Q_12610 [Actinokineospora sp. 24-640]
MTVGMVAALVFGGAAAANATTTTGNFDCQNTGTISVPVLSCNDVTVSPNLKIELGLDRVLNNTEISIIEDALNNIDIDVNNLVNVKDTLLAVCADLGVDVDKILVWIGILGPIVLL